MAFTVTRDTLDNNGPLFIRDVLRNELTDPLGTRQGSDWIVKSPVKNEDISFPMVILDRWVTKEEEITFGGAVSIIATAGLMIWSAKTDAIKYRDELAQDIRKVLQDRTSSDGTKTMFSQGFGYKSSHTSIEDGYIKGFSELIRIKEMEVEFVYMKR
jgi:hypothetical protein